MQNLIKFILKYSNFLIFIILEVVAFILIVNNNEYPASSALSTANAMVAKQQEVISNITGYFRLKSVNASLEQENADLRNQLLIYQNQQEDSLEHPTYDYAHLHLRHIPAKVIQLSTSKNHNFLTINKGERDGIRVGMGVRNAEGVVGMVCTTGEKFAVVIPVINTESHVSCRLCKNDEVGTTSWDGRWYKEATMEDVAAHVDVQEGDTIVTSGLTTTFPEGVPVGVVSSAKLGRGDSYYRIRMRLMCDYRHIKYVQVIDNMNAAEQSALRAHGVD